MSKSPSRFPRSITVSSSLFDVDRPPIVLSHLAGSILLCDCIGVTLGSYQQVSEGEIINLESPISAEELERRRQVKTGRTMEEVLQRLGL